MPQWKTEKHSAVDYNALYADLDHIVERFNHLEQAKTLARVVVEEVSNIVQHDPDWSEIKVNMEYSNQADNIKIVIIHDGTYFEPEVENITNVIGSKDVFQEYSRDHEIGADVRIRLQVKPGESKDV